MKILIVDDDKNIVESIAIGFQLQWQEVNVITAHDGEDGLNKFYDENPDIVLLDVMMPKRDGYSLLAEIRKISDVPVIMLTARGDELAKVKGLELGADDYITKPFGHLELFARVKAVLRRTEMVSPVTTAPSFVSGAIAVNFANHEVTRNGTKVSLTPTEYNLLYLLIRNAGRVVPFNTILDRVWGPEYVDQTDYLKTYVSRLRKKLEEHPESPQMLVTERGLGYRLVKLPSTIVTK